MRGLVQGNDAHEARETSWAERSSVPSVLVEPVAQRLRFVAGIVALFSVAYLVLLLGAGELTFPAVGLGALAIVASAAIAGVSMRAGSAPERLGRAGGAYLLFTAFALALAEFSLREKLAPFGGVSWSAIWIAFFPWLAVCNPRRTLWKTLFAASMSPLAFFVLSHGNANASARDLVILFAPVYISGLAAYAASRALSGLGARVSDARRMGMYELETRIAQGGMGEVWRARHRLLSRPAAVKLIRSEPEKPASAPGSGGVAERRFEREAQVTASLKSPHTVELYDFGVTETGTIYYVMELLEGADLEELVKREGPLEPQRVVHILKQTLDSLAEAHQHGLVHRDIKPANLHLSRRGLENDFVKVLDFGLVRNDSRAPKASPSLTAENGIVGTPAYMAPELITGEHDVDARADIYALGCVAYYLLTGSTVFEAENMMQMAVAHVTSKPVPPSVRAGHPLPAGLERIVLACLEKRPEDRPQTAVALLAMLRELELSEKTPAEPERATWLPPVSRPGTAFN